MPKVSTIAPRPFHLLIATDGSAAANAALVTAVHLPWPAGTVASAIVANQRKANMPPPLLSAALEDEADRTASVTLRSLTQRWKDPDVRVITGWPADVVVKEARRLPADVIVLGWRGHGVVRRHLMGSVSRRVVRQAPCSVLVVRHARTDIRRVTVGFDGSPRSKRAVELVAGFSVPQNGRVTLITTVDPMFVSLPLVPEERREAVEREVARVNRERLSQARQALEEPTRLLRHAGWKVTRLVKHGEPLTEILSAVKGAGADLLVIGVAGQPDQSSPAIGGIADAALNLSSVPVLVVR